MCQRKDDVTLRNKSTYV